MKVTCKLDDQIRKYSFENKTDLDIKELANRIGVHRSTLSDIVNNSFKSVPSLSVMGKLALFFKCGIDDLVTITDDDSTEVKSP